METSETLTHFIFSMLRTLFFVALGITLLVLAIIELFTGSFATSIVYLILHGIYGHTVITRQAEYLLKIAKEYRSPSA